MNGFEVLNACFDDALGRMPNLVAFGEDVGQLGDVNQGFLHLQKKYGALRVADTGIREQTIMGQAIGLALRGFRPIAEIQYLDYVLYGLQTLSDDLASLSWRTAGAQAAPVIVRTRGHRLEGIWHSGSQMGGLLHLTRGIWLCVPRNMTQAAGMYNTLLAADDPAIVVEVLNGYRHKERLPSNVGSFRVPLGIPETLREGRDATVVTYGACCPIVQEAAELLARTGIEIEIVDVQTLSPFDRENRILDSLRRTSRLVIVDEDVPGGASAWLMQQIVERMGGFWWLDAPPLTVTGREHRPAYGSDGDYFSKPSREEIFRAIYDLMRAAHRRGSRRCSDRSRPSAGGCGFGLRLEPPARPAEVRPRGDRRDGGDNKGRRVASLRDDRAEEHRAAADAGVEGGDVGAERRSPSLRRDAPDDVGGEGRSDARETEAVEHGAGGDRRTAAGKRHECERHCDRHDRRTQGRERADPVDPATRRTGAVRRSCRQRPRRRDRAARLPDSRCRAR